LKKSLDVLILFVLVIARARIDTLADLVLPQRHQDVRRLVSGWWPSASLDLLADWLSDPITLTLISVAFGLTVLYFVADAAADILGEHRTYRLKLGLVYAIILVLVFGKTLLLIGLRHITDPAAYTHDGGVIQTEATIQYFLAGKNPYIEDYLDTPMAAWGIEFRTALYHYPYLPWTFVFSTPFYLLSQATLGWFDQRMVYLLLFALTLLLAQALARTRQEKLLVVLFIGLNPILASDVIFGQNDSFILFWMALALWLLRQEEQTGQRHWVWLGSLAFGLACASKSTAWFLVPFWMVYLLRSDWGERLIPPPARWPALIKKTWQQNWPVLAALVLVVGPWFVWSPDAMVDDIWRWSAGTAAQTYQIRGWGLSNFVLALQWATDRLAYWPFWLTEVIIATPVLILLLWRQSRRHNTMGTMLYGYVALLFAFFYASRFLNENYLGYLASFLALALVVDPPTEKLINVTRQA
jgi:hypothetical protein